MNMNPKYALLSAVLLIAVIFIVGCHNTTTDPAAKYFTNQSCENISNQSEQNSCYEELALSRQKVEICEKIITPDPFNSGKMTCYIKIAEKTGNTSLCFTYARYDSSAICLRNIAVSRNDSSVCELDSMEQDTCYLALAVKRSRVDVCDKISNQDIKQKCIDEVTKGIKYYCLNYEAC